ncbi:MAG: hypothetical protein ACXWQO_11775 [Bdellovibrionota bacterium]
MKLILVAFFSFASVVAQASEIICSDVKAGPDYGFYLHFDAQLNSVEVSSQSIAGPRVITRLPCQPAFDTMPVELNAVRVLAMCSEPGQADAGYVVSLERKNADHKMTATLAQQTRRGQNHLANFTCKVVK